MSGGQPGNLRILVADRSNNKAPNVVSPRGSTKIVRTEPFVLESRAGWISGNSYLTPGEWGGKRPGRIMVVVPMFWFLGRGDFTQCM